MDSTTQQQGGASTSDGSTSGSTGSTTTPSTFVINLSGVQTTSQGNTDTDVQNLMAKFSIPDEIKAKYPELISLVIQSESMTDDERQYWFQILPIMTEDQIKKFREILDTEKKQLETLDKEYEAQLTSLNAKHNIEWKEFESKEKKRAIEANEKKAQSEDAKAQEDLLAQLNQI